MCNNGNGEWGRFCIRPGYGDFREKTSSVSKRGFHINASTVLASVGFGLTLTWCMLASHTIGFTSSTLGVETLVNPRMFYLSGILLLAVAYIAAPGAFKRADRALRYVLPLLSAFATACFGLAYHQTLFDATTLAVGSLFVVGIGFFWFLARYILMLARTQGFKRAVGAIAGGLIVKLPLVPLIGFLVSPELQVVVAISLPIVSALVFEAACALARSDAERRGEAGEGDLSEHRTVYGVPISPRTAAPTSQTFRRNALTLIAVSAILLAVIRSVSFLGLWGDAVASASLSSALLVAFVVPAVFLVAFAYFVLVRMADFTLTMRFQPAMLLILAGFFVVALQASPDSDSLPFLTDVIQIDELFAHLLYWTVIVTALDALDIPSYRVIGMGEAIFAAASIAWMLLLGDAEVSSNIFVLLAIYVVVIGAMYATWLGGKRRMEDSAAERASLLESDACDEPAGPADGVGSFDGTVQVNSPLVKTVADTCLSMAKRYALSPRETEVFVLLAQGRTRAFIQDELVLSNSTVKTHVSHIYAKMDVRDRQQMMDLIWQGDVDAELGQVR